MSSNGSNGLPSASRAEPASHLSRVRSAWAQTICYLTSSASSSHAHEGGSVHSRGSLQQQQQQSGQQVYAGMANVYTSASSTSLTPAPPQPGMSAAAAASTSVAQGPHINSFGTQPATTVTLSAATALELMRTYHMYVRVQKTRWRCVVLCLFAVMFFSSCTFRGPQEFVQDALDSNVYSGRPGNMGNGGVGGSSGGGGAVVGLGPGGGPGVAGGLAGSGVTGAGGLDGDGATDDLAHATGSRRRYLQPPWILQVLLGWASVPGRMEMEDVAWWPPSNRTTESSDPNSERGLNVGTPNAASLSVARSQPPWSAGNRRGVVASVARALGYVLSFFFTPEPPSYEQALSTFFRTRQAMTEGTCNRCQAQMIEQEVRAERTQYRQFLRESKLRVPLLLYYNRLPVYAMIQHFRLMRVRNYQLLDYVSRADAVLRRPETVANDVSNDAPLHARELDFELTRLSFVFYLQRLHLRALRHADAMRLETFHFLRHLSSSVPTLRQIWRGQDHCSWRGVSCVVVRVPLNLLVDDEHPAVQAFVEDLFSVCRGPDCKQRRCIPPACGAYTAHLTRRLFTAAAPGYWMKWDRTDDTAAMDEMIFQKQPPRKAVGAEAAAAAAASQQPQQPQSSGASNAFGTTRRTSSAGNAPQTNGDGGGSGKAEGDGVPPPRGGSPTAYAAARASRAATSSSRTVWTEQQFAYEHPELLLADPVLLVDVDMQTIMEEVVRPITPLTQVSAAVRRESDDPAARYHENVERAVVEDLLPMQKKLLHTMAAAAPRGVRFGKQRRSSGTLTIPFTFVMLNLANMGLRGYLPDFYDPESPYDVSEAATSATSVRSVGISGGAAPVHTTTTSTSSNSNNNNSGKEPGEGVDDDRTGQRSTTANPSAGRGGRQPEVHIQGPRSDVYWGRLSRQRMLENRNLTTNRLRRPVAGVQAIANEMQRVLRRVEKIGMRNHHEDLAAYFSEVAALAQFQNERWSPYRWPEAMITVTNAVSHSAARRLYPIVEDNAFSSAFAASPVYSVDHHVALFGEINARLVALLSIDVSGNPLLSHLFPRTWLSIPLLQSVRTQGSSVLAKPLHMRARSYNQSYYCPPGSGVDEASPYAEDARRSKQLVLADSVREGTWFLSISSADGAPGGVATQTSLHDRDFIGAELYPPYEKIDAGFSMNGVDTFLQQSEPHSSLHHLFNHIHTVLDSGLLQGVRRLWTRE
jgi:hypothetical protein